MSLKINEIKEILLKSAYTELPEKINMFIDEARNSLQESTRQLSSGKKQQRGKPIIYWPFIIYDEPEVPAVV